MKGYVRDDGVFSHNPVERRACDTWTPVAEQTEVAAAPAAPSTPASDGAADLPEALRVPLDSLHADAGYLCGRLLNGSMTQEQVVATIRRRIDAAKVAALAAGQAVAPAEPEPDELRAIAREARNSSGSASDDCGSAMYVLYGWRAAMSKASTPAMDGGDAGRLERERICAAIKAEDDYCVDHGGYMLDSDDCIKIVRGEWVRPDFAIDAARAAQKDGEKP